MISIVFAQRCSVAPPTRPIAGPSPQRKIAAAAPSPKSAAEMISALVARSSLNARVHNSIDTSKTVVPGSLAAIRAAVPNPVTPPAHPKPKMGIRRTSGRKPSRGRTRASRLGVAMPVDDTVITASIWRASSAAASSALRTTSSNSLLAPAMYEAVRSGHSWLSANHVSGSTEYRRSMPVDAKTLDSASYSAKRWPKKARANSDARACSMTLPGNAVASESSCGVLCQFKRPPEEQS